MTIQHPDGSDGSSLDSAQNEAQHTHDGEQSHDGGPSHDGNGAQAEREEKPAPDPSGSGGQVSEAGGASLNAETSAGGADAVPDAHG